MTKWKDLPIKDKLSSIIVLVIICFAGLWICTPKNTVPPEELKKVKIISNEFRSWGGIYNSSVHRITVKNETGKDIDYIKLKLIFKDSKSNLLKEEEVSFNNTKGLNSFGNVEETGRFKNNSVVVLKIGDWNRNAYGDLLKNDNKIKIGMPSEIYLGEDAEKVNKVETVVEYFNYAD